MYVRRHMDISYYQRIGVQAYIWEPVCFIYAWEISIPYLCPSGYLGASVFHLCVGDTNISSV